MLRLHYTCGGLGMHQGKNQQSITEYHLCSECKDAVNVPTDPDFRSFELCCLKKRSECKVRHRPLKKKNASIDEMSGCVLFIKKKLI